MLETFIPYMSAQKLRTPKGLATLQAMARPGNRNLTLMLLQRIRNITSTARSGRNRRGYAYEDSAFDRKRIVQV